MDPYRGSAIPDSPGACPRCPDLDLEPKHAGELTVALCRQCRGVWLDGSKMLDLFAAGDEELQMLARLDDRPRGNPTGDAACPRCRAVMQRQTGAIVEYDACAAHGVWFDEGELRALLVNAGIALDRSPAASPAPVSRIRRILDRVADLHVRDFVGSSLPKK